MQNIIFIVKFKHGLLRMVNYYPVLHIPVLQLGVCIKITAGILFTHRTKSCFSSPLATSSRSKSRSRRSSHLKWDFFYTTGKNFYSKFRQPFAVTAKFETKKSTERMFMGSRLTQQLLEKKPPKPWPKSRETQPLKRLKTQGCQTQAPKSWDARDGQFTLEFWAPRKKKYF